MRKKSRKVVSSSKAKAYVSKKALKGDIPLNADDDYDDVNMDSLLGNDDLSSDEQIAESDSEEEEEVLPITDDEESEEEIDDTKDDSDIEDEEHGLPNKDSWGKKKSAYYNADFVDEDRGRTYREEDMEKAKLEEEEALAIQRSVLSNIQTDNLGAFMMFESDEESAESKKEITEDVHDWVSVSKHEKLKYLKKTSPEFLPYVKEFKEKITELKDKFGPLHDFIENGKLQIESIVKYVDIKYNLLMNYCINLSFYMMIRSEGAVLSNHPVFQRIASYKNLLEHFDTTFAESNKNLDDILEKLRKNKVFRSKNKPASENIKSKDMHTDSKAGKKKVTFESTDDIKHVAEEATTDEKRTITYQIAKNKGLLPQRKKEHRNPRVHHKLKFKKAKIRRKGQVRNVVRETKRYQGEHSGISSHVIKSTKYK